MKKYTRFIMALLLLVGVVTANIATTQAIEPRYVGASNLTSTLTISSGTATCTGRVKLQSGYTADLKAELKQDGTTIKTWTGSGSWSVTAGGDHYVTSGHKYVVTTTATVYNSSGKWVESISVDSIAKSF